MAVAQLVESRIVIPVVVGSIPISHPIPLPDTPQHLIKLPLYTQQFLLGFSALAWENTVFSKRYC